jgi:hypothetical protein
MFLFWKRAAVIFFCVVLVIFVYGSLFMPGTWQWGANNLQVRLFNKANERQHVGSYGCGAGWSKLSFFLGDWWRPIGPGTWKGGNTVIVDSSDFHIAWVSPKGVTVRVRYQENFNSATTSIDKLIFIPSHESARVDASPDIYITGYWE